LIAFFDQYGANASVKSIGVARQKHGAPMGGQSRDQVFLSLKANAFLQARFPTRPSVNQLL
jgi:hypothetical protein